MVVTPGVALVRRPGARLSEAIVTHQARSPVDVDVALAQWESYVAALQGSGWEIVEVEGDDRLPDAVFVEDTVIMHGDTAVICRPGAPARRAEVGATEETLGRLGVSLLHLGGSATLEGGDVLKTGEAGGQGDTVYVGASARSNRSGYDQLAAHLEARGATVVNIPTTKALHLKSAVTALPDGTVIGYLPLVDDPSLFPRFLAVPEEPGAHVVCLGASSILMSSRAPRSAELFSDLGYEPVLVDISEFEKLDGCVTCLSVRLRR